MTNYKQDELIEEFKPLTRQKKGMDFLNLTEFPLAILSRRVPKGVKTLEFSGELYDKTRGEKVRCEVVLTGSDKWGLTRTFDEDVLMALFQITKRDGMRSKTIRYTRYELIETLGWNHSGTNYKRIEESMNRWVSLTISFKNAWWRGESEGLGDNVFHVIDNVKTLRDAKGKEISTFTWSDELFEEIEEKRLRTINMDVFNTLSTAIAKRLYRWLDKTFSYTRIVEYDLKQLMNDKFGMWRGENIASLKRKLKPAIENLERVGFLEPMPYKERFYKERVGRWYVVFRKKSKEGNKLNIEFDEGSKIRAKMKSIGVSDKAVTRILSDNEKDYVERKIEQFEAAMAKNPDSINNPAGYLIQLIGHKEWEEPKDFKSNQDKEKESSRKKERNRRKAALALEKKAKELSQVLRGERSVMIHQAVNHLAATMSEDTERGLRAYINKNKDKELVTCDDFNLRTEVIEGSLSDPLASLAFTRARVDFFQTERAQEFAKFTFEEVARKSNKIKAYDKEVIDEALQLLV